MRRKYTDEQFIQAVKDSFSIREVLKKLNLSPTGGSYKLFYMRCQLLNADISHFTGQGHLKNKSNTWAPKKDLKSILVENSHFNSNHLRNRLIKENYFKHECMGCHLSEWMGQPIKLELEHINGINTDNRLENLKILCPNCHSLTETYRGKNKKK